MSGWQKYVEYFAKGLERLLRTLEPFLEVLNQYLSLLLSSRLLAR
jgi:hypothetical protein